MSDRSDASAESGETEEESPGHEYGGSVADGADPQVAVSPAELLLEGADPTPVNELDEIDKRDRNQDIDLKRMVAWVVLAAMIGQLAVADVIFFLYGQGEHWQMPTAAIDVWLAATVVEVIGIVLVIAKYLFPPSGPVKRRGHN